MAFSARLTASIVAAVASLFLAGCHRPVAIPPAASPQVPSLLDQLPAYDTLEEAGVRAIERAYRCSHYYECSGVIVQRDSDGKFVVGPVRSDYSGDSVGISTRVPPGGKLVADFHTHPCLPVSHDIAVFSPNDVASQTKLGIVGFMGELCTGKVHRFIPGKSPLSTLSDDHDTTVSAGDIVGQIAVDGKSLEPATGML